MDIVDGIKVYKRVVHVVDGGESMNFSSPLECAPAELLEHLPYLAI